MLHLAAEVADGAFTNFMPLSGAPAVLEAFGSADKELACRFFAVPGPEDAALDTARRLFAAYATVPVYSDFLRWLGWAEAIDPVVEAWTSGDRRRALELVPETLLRETFLFGPYEAQRERLAASPMRASLLPSWCSSSPHPSSGRGSTRSRPADRWWRCGAYRS